MLKLRGFDKLTPSHVEDSKTIQLVPSVLHGISNVGGASLIKKFGAPLK